MKEGVPKLKTRIEEIAKYVNAVMVALRLEGISYEREKVVEIKYKDHYVGYGYPDLVVGGKLAVEFKAIGGLLGPNEEQQLRNYLRLLNIDFGLLINFQCPGKSNKKGTELQIKEISKE